MCASIKWQSSPADVTELSVRQGVKINILLLNDAGMGRQIPGEE